MGGTIEEERRTKGERTRERIVDAAARLFNRQGYAATSINDVLAAARIEKGGLYRHFASKEALAAEAFTYAATAAARHHLPRWEAPTARERLLNVIASFGALADGNGPIGGGCPLFNAAVEGDDGDPHLRRQAADALRAFHGAVATFAREGVAAGELRATVDPDAVASVLVATLEGALVLARACDEPAHMQRAAVHCTAYVASLAADA